MNGEGRANMEKTKKLEDLRKDKKLMYMVIFWSKKLKKELKQRNIHSA